MPVAEAQSTNTFENALGSSGNGTLTGNDGDNILSGLAGNDILEGDGGRDILIADRSTSEGSFDNRNIVYGTASFGIASGSSGSGLVSAVRHSGHIDGCGEW